MKEEKVPLDFEKQHCYLCPEKASGSVRSVRKGHRSLSEERHIPESEGSGAAFPHPHDWLERLCLMCSVLQKARDNPDTACGHLA